MSENEGSAAPDEQPRVSTGEDAQAPTGAEGGAVPPDASTPDAPVAPAADAPAGGTPSAAAPDADTGRPGDGLPDAADIADDAASRGGLSTAPAEAVLPRLNALEMARWAWRQLTSMRIALILLFLLALAAVPGSLIPQVTGADPTAVAAFHQAHHTLAPIYDKLQLFNVFGSVWFEAIYTLLFISLIGCVLPRSWAHFRAMRARPPRAPRNLGRLPTYRRYTTGTGTEEAVAAAHSVLRRRRFRTLRADGWVAAEKGYLRETGNLVFHVALLLVLVAVAYGKLYGYSAYSLVVQGGGYSDTVNYLEDYAPGDFFHAGDLPPYTITLDSFNATYQESGSQIGAARSYDADLTVRDTPTSAPRQVDLVVNHPLDFGSTEVFLANHGYAPEFIVKDGRGNVVFNGPAVFLPQDTSLSSSGVVKVPDAQPQQLAFSGWFFPTGYLDPATGYESVFPAAENPTVTLTAFTGDLGLNSGVPQNVYTLNTSGLTQLKTAGGQPVTAALTPGQSMTLPNGLGSITFSGYTQWVRFQINSDPGKPYVLVAAGAAVLGLLLSLRVRRRRVWVRVAAGADGRTVVEIGGLARSENGELDQDVERITQDLLARVPVHTEDPPDDGGGGDRGGDRTPEAAEAR